MAILRQLNPLIGTNTTSGVTIANNGTSNGAEVDFFNDNTSVGDIWVYVWLSAAVTSGSIDIYINNRWNTGLAFKAQNPTYSISSSAAGALIPLGRRAIDRFAQVDVTNNATGASITVSVLYSLEKVS
jgi:hypothetical protein